jgi:flagellar motor switch protein FliM
VGYSDQATVGSRRRRGEARTYDFRRPVRLAREHAHVLKVAMGTFGRQSTTVLTTSLRVVSTLTLSDLEELSYDEQIGSLEPGTVCAVLSMEPLPGKALLTMEQRTLLQMIDYLLGGPGTEEQPDRPVTDIEQALVRHLLTRVLRELAYALEPIGQTNPALVTLESNAQFVQAAAPTDPMVVVHFELELGERRSHLALCLPYAMLADGLGELSKAGDAEEKARLRLLATQQTTKRLADVEVDVAVRFDPIQLPSAQIGRLTVGDVLPIGHRTSAPLSVTSAATAFAKAVPGSSGKRLAALVVSRS